MRKLIPLMAVAMLCAGTTLVTRAQETKEKTITGEGQCAKCSLNETEKCENAIVVKEDGKSVTYYMPLTNDVSKKFHSNLCKAKKKVKATGTVKEEDGRKILTPSKLELVRESNKRVD